MRLHLGRARIGFPVRIHLGTARIGLDARHIAVVGQLLVLPLYGITIFRKKMESSKPRRQPVAKREVMMLEQIAKTASYQRMLRT